MNNILSQEVGKEECEEKDKEIIYYTDLVKEN